MPSRGCLGDPFDRDEPRLYEHASPVGIYSFLAVGEFGLYFGTFFDKGH